MTTWRKESIPGDGIVVGVDSNLEWALPWWWLYYSSHNNYPVTFVDFGMTEAAKNWCRERGEFCELNIKDSFVAFADQVDPKRVHIWEQLYTGPWWDMRRAWFQKPFALLQSAYARTIWLDIDCEVRGSLAPLFPYCENPAGLSLVAENAIVQENFLTMQLRLPGEVHYNSAVVVYAHGSRLIQEWAERSVTENDQFRGDQDLLSRILFERQAVFTPLPNEFNHLDFCDNPNALIQHWGGGKGKRWIFDSLQKLSVLFPDVLALACNKD